MSIDFLTAFVPGPAKEKKTNIVPSSSTAKSSSSSAPPPSIPASVSASTPLQPSRNPNLADFDSLMEQMENELNAKKRSKPTPPTKKSTSTPRPVSSKPTPKPSKTASSERVTIETLADSEREEDDQDVEKMDAELQQMLKDMGGEGDGGAMDYNLVKNFLYSFQSHGGFAGPAGNVSGRLGFNLPRGGSS